MATNMFFRQGGLPSLTALKHSVAVLNSIPRRTGNQWSEYSTSELVTFEVVHSSQPSGNEFTIENLLFTIQMVAQYTTKYIEKTILTK